LPRLLASTFSMSSPSFDWSAETWINVIHIGAQNGLHARSQKHRYSIGDRDRVYGAAVTH
jgi:hypothetical protein